MISSFTPLSAGDPARVQGQRRRLRFLAGRSAARRLGAGWRHRHQRSGAAAGTQRRRLVRRASAGGVAGPAVGIAGHAGRRSGRRAGARAGAAAIGSVARCARRRWTRDAGGELRARSPDRRRHRDRCGWAIASSCWKRPMAPSRSWIIRCSRRSRRRPEPRCSRCARIGITDPKQAFAAMLPRLRAQRQRRNLPDGYGVLAAEQSCVPMLHVDRMPARTVRRILLASDGYYRLVDHYGAASDAELVRRTAELGADALLNSCARSKRRTRWRRNIRGSRLPTMRQLC